MSKNLLVLCGGRSAERDVSCVSAAAVLRNLPRGWRPLLIHIDGQGRWRLQSRVRSFASRAKPEKFPFDKTPAHLEPTSPPRLVSGRRCYRVDVVFPVLHGPYGEDGTIQGLLDFYGLPYVGSGVLGSAVGMDKDVTKRLAGAAGLPLLRYAVAGCVREASAARKFRFPVFVKPLRLGSSVGVYKVKTRSGLAAAAAKALRFDTRVVIEEGIEAREIECAVLGRAGEAGSSIVGEIRPNAEFYSYEAKYLDPDGAELIVPANLSAKQSREVRKLSLRAFEALGCEGLARVDFLMDRKTGKLWFNEVNTLPGFTSISMYPRLWAAGGLSFRRLVGRLLSLALARHRRRASLRITR